MRAILFFLLMVLASHASALDLREWRKDAGSVRLQPFEESVEQAFIRDYVETSAEQQIALDPRGEPPMFEIEDIWVGHYDLNDDGVDELILYFNSFYHCGRGGCTTILFEGGEGRWREIGQANLEDIWVGQEKAGAYRIIYSSTGRGVRWAGKSYQSFCAGFPNEWKRDNSDCSCCRVYAREKIPMP